jgi:ribonuclease HI
MSEVNIFTDGACLGNPGPGGWACILSCGPHRKELSGKAPQTTNNRMELQAAISALQALKKPCKVTVTSDSQYVVNGITKWLVGWKQTSWKQGTVKNQDLWQQLDKLCQVHEVEWRWVRGHNGHPENERCDQLANEAAGIRAA